MLLVILIVPCLIFVACSTDDDDELDCSEGHTWEKGDNPKRHTLIQAATCVLPEIRERKCRLCGFVEQYEAKNAYGHRYDDSKKIYLNDATCEQDGHYIKHCFNYAECGYTADYYEVAYGTATGHTYLNYIPTIEDPLIGVSKCADCSSSKTIALGVKLDMEGDRSHLSYQAMSLYYANLNEKDVVEYETVGNNTCMYISRPEGGYLGGSQFGMILNPNEFMTNSDIYIFEATLMLARAKDDVVIVGRKSVGNQEMRFLTYNSEKLTLDGVNGTLYNVSDEDYEKGVKVSLAISDKNQWYQVYVNDALVSDPIKYVGNYFYGFDLSSIEIISDGTGKTAFGVDDVNLYKADEPEFFDGAKNLEYIAYQLTTGQMITVKRPAEDCAGHNYVVKDNVNDVVKPDCDTAGYTVETCDKCGGQILTNEVAPLGHNYTGTPVKVAPTCTSNGYSVYTCSNDGCGNKMAVVDETATPVGHTHGSNATTTEATCTSPAYKISNCAVCGGLYEEQLGAKRAHELGDEFTVQSPTCSTAGITYGPCIHCGEIYYDESTTVEKFGHIYFDIVHVEATCSQSGYDEYECISCRKYIKENLIPALGHQLYYTISDNKITYSCTRCTYEYSYVKTTNVLDEEAVKDDEELSKKPASQRLADLLGNVSLLDSFYVGSEGKAFYTDDKGGNINASDGGFKYAEWRNFTEKINGVDFPYGRMTVMGRNSDPYINFPKDDKTGAGTFKKDTVWEFDVRFPGGDIDPSGLSISFSCTTNLATAAGFGAIKIYPNGSVVFNNVATEWPDNFGTTNPNGNQSQDILMSPAGTVTSDKWTRIALVLNHTEGLYTCYVDGVGGISKPIPSYTGTIRYLRFNFMSTNGNVTAMEFKNMFYFNGSMPTYLGHPDEPVDYMGTDFNKYETKEQAVPTEGINITDIAGADIYGKLSLNAAEGLAASLKDGKLTYTHTAGNAAGSVISAKANDLLGTQFTTRIKAEFKESTGKYHIFALKGNSGTTYPFREATLPIVYVEDGSLKITGKPDYSKAISGTSEMEIAVEVRTNSGKTEYDVYVDGTKVAENISFKETDFGKVSKKNLFLEFFNITDANASVNAVISSVKVHKSGYSYEEGKEPENQLGTDFGKYYLSGTDVADSKVDLNSATDIFGNLTLNAKEGLTASLNGGKLSYSYTAGKTAGSVISGDVLEFVNRMFTVQTEVRFTSTSGKYNIIELSDGSKTLPIVYVEDEKIKVAGTGYIKPISTRSTANIEVVVKPGKQGNFYDVYIDGVLRGNNISYADTDFGKASKTKMDVELFKIVDKDQIVNIEISYINIYDGQYILNSYIGMEKEYTVPGHKDVAVSFDGTQTLAGLLPIEEKIPGGYYYKEIAQSYLGLYLTPDTEKSVANIRYTRVNANGVIDSTDGYYTLTVSDFGTYGVFNLGVDDFYGLKMAGDHYDISVYTKMLTRFYVKDSTSGYNFKVLITYRDGDTISEYVVFEGTKSTGWHTVEKDLADAPDAILGISVVFVGVDNGGTLESKVDGFTFALENVSFKVDDVVLKDTNFVYAPHAKCNEKGQKHSYGEEIEVEANCDTAGYIYKRCEKCDYVSFELMERDGHNFVSTIDDLTIEATCEENGCEYYECGCGAITKKILPKTGHDFIRDRHATEEEGKRRPTCDIPGIDIYICINDGCVHYGKKFGMETDPIGHTPAPGAIYTIIVADSCTEVGITQVSECARCHKPYDIEIDNIKDHNWRKYSKNPTCTEDGYKYEKCTRCQLKRNDESHLEKYKAKGHSVPAEYLWTWVDATCTHIAGWQYQCAGCDMIDIIPTTPDAKPLAHDFGEWITITPNTCGADGFRDKICKTCGGWISEIGTSTEKAECVLKATGVHSYRGEYTYSEDYVEGVSGQKWYDCRFCDSQIGKEGAGTLGLVFTYNNAGAYVITDYTGTDVDIIIPAIYEGKPVIIGTAFKGNDKIESVTIAKGVSISNSSFMDCTALKSIKLAEDITEIPAYAFSGCTALNSIELPATCTVIRNGAFSGCSELISITMNGTLENVMENAFMGCAKLAVVKYVTAIIPYDVIRSGNDAFTKAGWAKIV